MFKNPFSFEGRIRRSEYGISILIIGVLSCICIYILLMQSVLFGFVLFIPLTWFKIAQSAKRCHDLGNDGAWQLIPFYSLVLLFSDGEPGSNLFGDNPKGIASSVNYNQTPVSNQYVQSNTETSYQGGYAGGHNNPNSVMSNNQINQPNSNSEYKSGDLYK